MVIDFLSDEALGTPAELSIAGHGNPNGWEHVLVWGAWKR